VVVSLELEREGEVERRLGVVQVPRVLPRLVWLPREDESHEYIFLGSLIGAHLQDLFPGTRILGWWHFRVTRNSELYIDEEDSGNLLKAVEQELHNRRRGAAVRLEVDHDCPAEIYTSLLETLELSGDDLYLTDGPLNSTRLMAIYEGDHSPELRDRPFIAPVGSPFAASATSFPSSDTATCCCITPTRPTAAWSISWKPPPPIRTCSRSNKRFIARVAIRGSSAPS
jgi:polyphosphate kinase